MNIVVLMRMVPDVVEELEVAPDGKGLDLEYLRRIPSESDDHALEEAILLKERHGGKVTVVAPDAPDVDDTLFAALARGADRVIKVTDAEVGFSTRRIAAEMGKVLKTVPGLMPADLILTGVQAIDDLDGLMAPVLAYHLNLPNLEIVTKVELDSTGGRMTVTREYPGSVRGEFDVKLPAVLGIQAAEKPPRYVPVSKIMAAKKTLKIEVTGAPPLGESAPPEIEIVEMRKFEPASRAEMLEGDPEQAAQKLAGILAEKGIL